MKVFLAPFCLLVASGTICAQQITGIGVALAKESDALVVKRILPDSPTARSNAIRVGDRILEIGEANTPAVETRKLELEEAVALVRGAEGTEVRLTILPAGKDESHTRIVTLVRGELKELSRWGDGQLLPKGATAPTITWIRLGDRRSGELADLVGKVAVLEFWATWCGPCQPVVASLQDLQERFPHWNGKVVLVCASVDETPDLPEKHLKEKGWGRTYNVWIDAEATKTFAVNALPTTYIISSEGTVISSGHVLDVAGIVDGLVTKK